MIVEPYNIMRTSYIQIKITLPARVAGLSNKECWIKKDKFYDSSTTSGTGKQKMSEKQDGSGKHC